MTIYYGFDAFVENFNNNADARVLC